MSSRTRGYLSLAFTFVGLVLGSLLSTAYAQVITNITTDGTLGTTVAPSGNLYNINGGTIKGTNQFHSFGQFSVGTGDIASFNGPAGIQNILSRVTGGNVSDIDGTLRSTISGANLFLMNPTGILFGPNAQLDVSGSFHATTADYIGLADGVRFNSLPAQFDNLLTTAPPAAFGFLTPNPAPIDVRTGVFDFDAFFATFNPGDGYTNILQVPVGQTLSFVGGTVNVGSGFLPQGFVAAPGGRVNLISAASPGEASFNNDGSINVGGFAQLGDIKITGNSFIDAKNIFIRGGRLEIEDATVFPGLLFLSGLPSPPPDGGSVDIGVSGEVKITATGEPFVNTPGIQVFAGSPGDLVSGDVPAVHIDANAVSVSGPGAQIGAARFGPENLNPPEIRINTQTLSITDGASIALLNFFEGPGGSLTVNADTITIANDVNSPIPTGIAAQSTFHPGYGFVFFPFLANADSGSILLNSNNLIIRGQAEVTSDSFAFGNGGSITVNARNALLTGPGSISSQSGLAGNSGDVTITVNGRIQMADGFRVTATTAGSGNAGAVSVTAGESIEMVGSNTRITSTTVQPADNEPGLTAFAQLFDGVFQENLGIPISDYASLRAALGIAPHNGDLMAVLSALNELGLTAVADLTPGDAGTVSVTAPALNMNGDTRIETSTGWDGNAGAVVADVGSLFLNNGAAIRSTSGTTLPTSEFRVGAGNAGVVTLNANDTIVVSGRSPTSGAGSSVSTTTFGDGDAGNIFLSATQINVQDGGSVASASGETVNGQLIVGTGNAGQISVSTPTLTMAVGGTISVSTFGAGNAGNILLNVGNLTQTAGSTIDSSTSGAGQGGDLTVTAANSVSISGTGTGLFSTASGSGAGGNVNIQAGQLVQLADNATLSAQSTGTATATAGNITINTPTFETQNASVTTGATLADGGNITITTTGSLVHLTDSQITTSVESGVGSGGNIAIDSSLIVLDDSQVLANAFGGPGGNINITGDVFLVNSGGQSPISLAGIVEASSALSTPGTINIEAAVTDVSGTVAQLPEAPLQATELLRAACAARFVGGKASSLVVGGRDGLPLQPGGLLPSPLYVAGEADKPSTISSSTGFSPPTGFSLLGSSDRNLNRYSLLPNFKCSL